MRVELVGFPEPACENPVEVLEGRAAELATQTQSDLDTPGGGHLPGVPRCGLGAALRRIHNRRVPMNDTIVEAVLEKAGSTGLIPESMIVRDRKSTRLNSSHSQISYAVFCLKKKKHHKE